MFYEYVEVHIVVISTESVYMWLMCVPLQEKGPLHRLQGRVESVGVKMVKVEEDVRVVREEVGGVEGRLGERLQAVEKSLCEVKTLLQQLVKSKTQSQEQ